MINLKFEIKKVLLPSIVALSIMNPLIVFAEANISEEIQENIVLTYEEALELGIKESNDLKQLELETDSATIKNDDILEDFGSSLYDPQVLAVLKVQKSDNINSRQSEKMQEYIEQALAFKLKSIFNNINLMEEDVDLKVVQLNNMSKKNSPCQT